MHDLAVIDWIIVAAYFAVILFVGIWFGRKEKSTSDFFVGGRNISWLPVLGSIVATEVSAATFLNLPGVGFTGNMTYLQMTIGSVLARFMIASVFLTAFYAANCYSIYQYLSERFGRRTQLAGAGFFIVTRLIASGIRLLIATTGVSLILDIGFLPCLLVFTLISLAYTSSGGIKAVIYTDCIQAVVFISGGILVTAFLLNELGLAQILELGREAGRFETFRFTPAESGVAAWFNDSSLFFVALAFGFLSTSAALGTDQDLTQRMLTCKKAEDAKRSVVLSGFFALAIAALFLFVGAAVYAYYHVNGGDGLPMTGDAVNSNKIFAYFIANALPPGLKGVLLVGALAAAMSSLDSAMAALSSSVVMDFFKPLLRNDWSEAQWVRLSRVMVGVFAVVLFFIAFSLKDIEQSFLWLSFKIAGIPYSVLLGVFLLGTLSKKGNDKANIIVMFSGVILVSVGLWAVENDHLHVAWQWILFFGTGWTVFVGALCKNQTSPAPPYTQSL